MTQGLATTRNYARGRATAAGQKPGAGEPRAGSTKTWRKYYKVQVIVADPELRQILNLTKLVSEDDVCANYNVIPDIQTMLQLLVEAAGEWTA